MNRVPTASPLATDSSQVALAHLTQRLRRLVSELRSQCRQGWDINALLRIHAELGAWAVETE